MTNTITVKPGETTLLQLLRVIYIYFSKLSNLHYTNKQKAYNIEIKNIKRNYYTCTEPYEPLHNKYKINDKKTNLITQS